MKVILPFLNILFLYRVLSLGNLKSKQMFQRRGEDRRILQQATITKTNLYMGFSIFMHYMLMNSLKQNRVKLVDRTSRVTNFKLIVASRKVL